MEEERVINLREPFHHGAVRGERFAQLHKRANDKNAHLHGALAPENIRCLESAVFSEDMGTVFAMLTPAFS